MFGLPQIVWLNSLQVLDVRWETARRAGTDGEDKEGGTHLALLHTWEANDVGFNA